jgi:hypothetical protein
MRDFLAGDHLVERFRTLDLGRQIDVAIYYQITTPEGSSLVTLLAIDTPPLRLVDALEIKRVHEVFPEEYALIAIHLLASSCGVRPSISVHEANIIEQEISVLMGLLKNTRLRQYARRDGACVARLR